jgi:hypothetical protein
MYILKIFSYIGLLLVYINTIIYFIGFARKGKAYIFFVIYLFALTIIQTAAEIYADRGVNNHFLSTYYLFFQFILLSSYFYYLFIDIKNKKSSVIKYLSISILLGLIVQYSIFPELYYVFNSLGFLLTTSAIILYSVFYLFEQMSKKLPFYYTNIGIFIYFISSSLIFASAIAIVSFNDKTNMLIWKINALLFIIYQLLILWEWMQNFYLKLMKRG